MFSECLPFSNIPHASRLFLDYLGNSPLLKPFYPRSTRISEWAKAEASRHRNPENPIAGIYVHLARFRIHRPSQTWQ